MAARTPAPTNPSRAVTDAARRPGQVRVVWPDDADNAPAKDATPRTTRLLVAFLGRTSTDDQQDPTLSIPRQAASCRAALPAGSVIVAHFYDIESGRKDLAGRGRSSAHERFDIPVARDGGIADLLAEVVRPDRRFDAVICESIDRVARRTYYGTQFEHQLEGAGVALFAADEPIVTSGKRSTAILTRRVKQSVAEWYVLEMLEKSWDGFCEHTRQGWNVGVPPYGYQAERVAHPVPARRAEGRTKTRLLPEPVRGPVVTSIFAWRVAERLGYAAIAERLNADLDRYPVPTSLAPGRQRADWARSTVRAILTNPKYTGYMVWNRRASKRGGKVNKAEDLVWSPVPTHEPLVTREMFDGAAAVAQPRQGSRNEPGANAHPQTKRSYLLRSFVICELCGRRMFGKTKKDHAYYSCQPGLNLGSAAERYCPEHPPTVWVREDALLDGVASFFAAHLRSPPRRAARGRPRRRRPTSRHGVGGEAESAAARARRDRPTAGPPHLDPRNARRPRRLGVRTRSRTTR